MVKCISKNQFFKAQFLAIFQTKEVTKLSPRLMFKKGLSRKKGERKESHFVPVNCRLRLAGDFSTLKTFYSFFGGNKNDFRALFIIFINSLASVFIIIFISKKETSSFALNNFCLSLDLI